MRGLNTSAQAAIPDDSIVIGRSVRMQAVFEFLRVIRDSESTVLITGESGTGKEVIATLLHQSSRRKQHPCVAVSCALFSDTLIESELFGHERGAFTGAIRDRPGRFELADGGTLFLDDIDDVPLSMQVKLLRVLQNRTIERLGATRTVPVNVRIIAGTKRDLKQMVGEGAFREDLYYRLNVLPIVLPPLRERREDIPDLMSHFLERYFRRRGENAPPISNGVKETFMRYSWPGNVRELENACERMAETCICSGLQVGCVDALMLFRPGMEPSDSSALPLPGAPDPEPISLDECIRSVEATLLRWALFASNGNKSRAAELLQIRRSTLGDRINRCGLGTATEPNVAGPVEPPGPDPISLDECIREVEATLLRWALNASGGNESRAAEILQIKRTALDDRINRCGLGQADAPDDSLHSPAVR
jgi:DNA-binding NtrC family response regulator